MERSAQKKRSTVKSSGVKKASPAEQSNNVNPTVTGIRRTGRLDSLGITLNSNTAKHAVILSEIIGKPVSKRRK